MRTPLTFASVRSVSALVAFVAFPLACGPGEAPPPVTPTPATSTSAPPPKVVIQEDRTPVESPPAGLVAHLHSTSPKSIVRAIKSYLPDIGTKIDPRDAVAQITVRRFLGRIVDIDKPVDAVVQLPPPSDQAFAKNPKLVVAFGVEDDLDIATALKGDARVDVLAGGVLRLLPANPAEEKTSSFTNRCLVAPAIGPAKRRLVCAVDPMPPADLAAVTGWLARGITRKPEPASAMHGELDIAAVRKRYADELEKAHKQAGAFVVPEIKIGKPDIDKVLKKLGVSAIDDIFDFVGEAESVSGDLTLPNEGPQVSLSLKLAGNASWISKMMLASADASGAPPATFGKLPGGAIIGAAFSKGSNASDALMVPVQKALVDLIEGAASELKWPKKDKDAALEFVRLSFMHSVDSAMVTGPGPKPVEPEKAGEHRIDRQIAHGLTRTSWSIGAAEREAKPMIDAAKAFSAMVTRPSFTSLVSSFFRDDVSFKITSKPLKSKAIPKDAFATSYEVAAFGIDKDDKGKIKKETPLAKLLAEQVIAPSGTRTYSAWGQNLPEGDLLSRLKGAMDGTGVQLSATSGFDFVTKGTPAFGMVVALDGMARSLVMSRTNKGADEWLPKLPDQGKSTFALKSSAVKAGNGGNVEIAAAIPRDLIALTMYFYTR